MASLREAVLRHAEFYLSALRVANRTYHQGGEAIKQGLALFDSEWINIQAGQAAAATLAKKDDAAGRLCTAYAGAVSLLELRLHPRVRLHWFEVALIASRRLKDRAAEMRHLNHLGRVYQYIGESHRAIEHYDEVLTLAREVSNRRAKGSALANLGITHLALGNLHS